MSSDGKRYTNYVFFSGGFKNFSKYGRPTPSIGYKHDMIFTESEFGWDSK